MMGAIDLSHPANRVMLTELITLEREFAPLVDEIQRIKRQLAPLAAARDASWDRQQAIRLWLDLFNQLADDPTRTPGQLIDAAMAAFAEDTP